jgi:phosphoenolpyruvate carboxykinase (GTP)
MTLVASASRLPEPHEADHRFHGRAALESWVLEMALLANPDRIIWCDGSATERERIVAEMF